MIINTRRNILDKIIITAMDRFVWFVLLVVMSHLVTEFTRVTGYARGSRNDLVIVNDSHLSPMPVQNMILYPNQEYGSYQRPSFNYNGNNNIKPQPNGYNYNYNTNNNPNNFNNPNNNYNQMQSNAAYSVPTNGNIDQYGAPSAAVVNPFGFSIQPFFDNIFNIPIATLQAVNRFLVAPFTSRFQQTFYSPPPLAKSADEVEIIDGFHLPKGSESAAAASSSSSSPGLPATNSISVQSGKKTLLREKSA